MGTARYPNFRISSHDTKPKAKKWNCYEEEINNIEKDFKILWDLMNRADFHLNVHIPEDPILDNYIQSVHHNRGEEDSWWDWFLEENGTDTREYVLKDVHIHKLVLKKVFPEERKCIFYFTWSTATYDCDMGSPR